MRMVLPRYRTCCYNGKMSIFSNAKKTAVSLIAAGVLLAYAAAAHAAPNLPSVPAGGYAPGTEIDPVCSPNSTDCVVKMSTWKYDDAGGYFDQSTFYNDFFGTTSPVVLVGENNLDKAGISLEGGSSVDHGIDILGNTSHSGSSGIHIQGSSVDRADIELSASNGRLLLSGIGAGANKVLTSDADGFATWQTLPGGLAFPTNGLSLIGSDIGLGGTLVQDTTLDQDGNFLNIVNTYADIESGNNGLLNVAWMRKNISPTQATVVGLMDTSGFGGDADTVRIGRLNFLGGLTTSMVLAPTSGTIDINSVQGTALYAGADLTLESAANASITSGNDIFADSGNDVSIFGRHAWYSGIGDGTITAGTYRTDFSMAPFDANPSVALELKKNQEYALGFSAIDTPGHQFSNIYYGVLDSSNAIVDITRIEAAHDEASIFAREVSGPNFSKFSVTSDYMKLDMNFQDRFMILQSGETGVGINNFDANTNGSMFQVGNGGSAAIGFVDNATGNWVAVSDARKKDNIADLSYGLDTVMRLSPKSYTMRSNGEASIGFLAQDVKNIVPESVFGSEEKGYGMAYQTLVPVTVKAIQELSVKLDAIESSAKSVNQAGLNEWFADAKNGIQSFFSNRVTTRTLCVADDGGETCLTRAQLDALLGGGAAAPVQGPDPVPAEDPSGSSSSSEAVPVSEPEQAVQPGPTGDPAPEAVAPDPETVPAPEQ